MIFGRNHQPLGIVKVGAFFALVGPFFGGVAFWLQIMLLMIVDSLAKGEPVVASLKTILIVPFFFYGGALVLGWFLPGLLAGVSYYIWFNSRFGSVNPTVKQRLVVGALCGFCASAFYSGFMFKFMFNEEPLNIPFPFDGLLGAFAGALCAFCIGFLY